MAKNNGKPRNSLRDLKTVLAMTVSAPSSLKPVAVATEEPVAIAPVLEQAQAVVASPAPAPAATQVLAPAAPLPLPTPVTSSPAPKFNRPTFKRVAVISAEEKAARQQWVVDSVIGIQELVTAYTASILDPETTPSVPTAYDGDGNVTEWRDATPEDLKKELIGTIGQVRERGLRETVVVATMDEMLRQFPHTREFLASFSSIARQLDGFYFLVVERISPLVERGEVNWLPGDDGRFHPYGSIYSNSGRIRNAVKQFVADVNRHEREELQAGALPLKDVLKAGSGEGHFSQAREGKHPAGTFRVRVDEGRVYPVDASESYREAFSEMVRLRIFVLTGTITLPGFRPSDKLREETAKLVRMFQSILHGYWKREFQTEERTRSQQAVRAVKDNARSQDRDKAFEMRNRAGLIPLTDTLVKGTPGSSNLHLAPRKSSHNQKGRLTPAFTWKGTEHLHVNGIVTRYPDGTIAISDCCASDEVLFAEVREPVEPGENFKNLPEPAREILRRMAATLPRELVIPAEATPSAEVSEAQAPAEQDDGATAEVTPASAPTETTEANS